VCDGFFFFLGCGSTNKRLAGSRGAALPVFVFLVT